MPSATLKATGNQVYSSGTVGYSGAGNYTDLNDASDSTSMTLMGGDAFASYPLTDMPADLLAVTSVTITIRCMNLGSKGDHASFQYAQLLKSDGSTPITSTVTGTSTSSATTLVMNPSSLFITDKASWDGAVLKIKQNSGTGSGTDYYLANVVIDYTTSGGSTSSQIMPLIFGGQL